jgi:prepilin-type N-terminal cleavage/methylation domain-containing protein
MRSINKKNRAFTLIELLVVVSIIGIFSTVVLASLNSARTRAKNTRIMTDIYAYTKALDLYKVNYGKYPRPNNPNHFTCLGDYPTDSCWQNNSTPEEPAILDAIKEYIPGLPSNTEPMTYMNAVGYYTGYVYRCNDPLGNTTCDSILLAWHLHGSSTCAFPGARVIQQLYYGEDTACGAWYPEIPPVDNY